MTAPAADRRSLDLRSPAEGRAPVPSSSAPAAGRRLLIVHNPVAGWRRIGFFRRIVRALESYGCTVEVRATGGPGDAETLARAADQVDAVVVAGGDGTVNEALNGLAQRAGAPLALAVIPLGTANVLAGELGMPRDPAGVARTVAAGQVVSAHLGRARDALGARRFSLMAGAGFDAQAVARVRTAVKRKLGKGAYVLAGLETAAAYGYPELTVTVDGTAHSCAQAVVCKGHFYAGRYVLCPDVRPWTPDLHVCLFERGGTWNALRYTLAMQLGRLDRLPDVRVVRGQRVAIDGPAGDPVQGDGDLLARLPVEIDLLPEAARFVVGDPA
jgi:YegS/Rv2252/BmrU family lipid kinase